MCGICGLISSSTEVPGWLAGMNAVQVHRGPDGGGTWVSTDGRVHLAHRRLAILDLSGAGAQPMVDPEGRYVITYNGEIYNYL